jgi:flagellar biosynthesis protein FlhF
MKIKRYVARNMKEALYLIKNDLGPEAMIVSSRKVREKGIIGLFRPAKIEVTAVIEQNNIDEINTRDWQDQYTKLPSRPSAFNLDRIKQCLLDMDIEEEIVTFLLKDLDSLASKKQEIKAVLQERMESIFKPAIRKTHKSNILAFVGVPGVGKTTTLAKIAAIYSLFNSFSISFITIDTYRVGAVEQMRIYGDIIGASVDVVMSPVELRQAIERNRNKDLILIDTAGRPSKNRYQLAELKNYLETIDISEIYLVINATTKKRDMIRILNDYKIIPYSQLIISKIDETELPGALINAAYVTGLPIAYITNGQDVPDDIEVASPELLASFVMKDVAF